MAPPKRLRIAPLDDPPTASSSDDDQPLSSKKPEDEVVDEEEEDSEEEGEESDQNEEDDEDEEGSSSEEEQVQPPSKNPPPSTPISNPKPDSGSESESGTESGSESGSESDSEQEPTPPNPKVKPLASKPMKAQPQAQAQSTPVPARSGTKRPNENSSKPAKKKTTTGAAGDSENEADGDGDVKMTGEDSKKVNQRVFTDEDEIAILKGLADFISKTGKDPMKDLAAFHSFVKKSIHGDATSEQLKRKVRGLKMKFKDGGSFTKEHDKKAFELSKKVWANTEGNNGGNNGGNEGEENGKVNEKTPKSTKKEAPVRNNGSAKKEIVVKNGAGKDEGGVDRSLALSEMCKFGEAAGLSLLNKNAVERGMGLLEESKADEFDEGWRKVQIAEMELFVTRGQLLKDQIRIALDTLKKKSIN